MDNLSRLDNIDTEEDWVDSAKLIMSESCLRSAEKYLNKNRNIYNPTQSFNKEMKPGVYKNPKNSLLESMQFTLSVGDIGKLKKIEFP